MIQAKTAKWFNLNYLIVIIICIIPLPYLFSDIVLFTYVDMYNYVDRALNIERGESRWFHGVSGGRLNLFPLLLYISFSIFGKSLLAIKYLYFFLLLIVLLECWWMGKLLFKNNSGLIAAIFVGTSFVHAHFLYFPHIDLPLLVLMNLCLIVLYVSLKNQSKRWFFLSGLLIGLTFLFKQTVILFLLMVPVYMILTKEYKNKVMYHNWIMQIIGVSLVLIPVTIITFSSMANLLEKHFDAATGKLGRSPSLTRFFHYLLYPNFVYQNKFLYHKEGALVTILFDQIMIFTGLVLFIITKPENKKAKQFLLTAFIIYLPWVIFIASRGQNYRQLLFPTFILFFMTGNVLYFFFEKVKIKIIKEKYLLSSLVVIVVLLGTIYFTRLSLLFNYISHFRETEIGKRAGSDPFTFLELRKKGVQAHRKKDYSTALKLFNQAIKLNPPFKVYGAMGHRASTYRMTGEYEKAIEDYNRIIAWNSKSVNAYVHRGITYRMLEQYRKAIEDFSKAISLNPKRSKRVGAYFERGNAYLKTKQYEKAIEDFNQVITLNPKNTQAYNQRGRTYKELKKYELAKQDFSQAKKLQKSK